MAAGYDLKGENGVSEMLSQFDRIVGLQYLKGMHLNDSKKGVGSHVDRHENIGMGEIGLEAFKSLMQDKRLDNIPMILETPDESKWAEEINTLYSLCN